MNKNNFNQTFKGKLADANVMFLVICLISSRSSNLFDKTISMNQMQYISVSLAMGVLLSALQLPVREI